MPSLIQLVEQTPLFLITLDQQGKFTGLNPAAEKCFARRTAELLGQPFTTVLDPFSHAKAALMLERTLMEGSVTDWELDHVQPGAPPILIGYTTTVLQNAAGEFGGIGAIGRGLSRQLELTARLADTNQQLEGALLQLEKTYTQLKTTQTQLIQSEKMRSLGQLVAGVAHEINNPAGFVANNLADLARRMPLVQTLFEAYAPLAAKADPAESARLRAAEAAVAISYLWQDLPDLVHESQAGIERIRQIVLSLRNFARLDEARLKESDLNVGLRSTVQIIRSQCHDRITLIEELNTLPKLWCNPGELNQVFMNLLINAMQSIEQQGSIWITSCVDTGKIVVTIRDSGSGMDTQTLARLGEPFFTTKPVGTGTGLGLAICFGIVAKHHGQLTFKSQLGQGTSARVEFPCLG